jgi:hypothetical protein
LAGSFRQANVARNRGLEWLISKEAFKLRHDLLSKLVLSSSMVSYALILRVGFKGDSNTFNRV